MASARSEDSEAVATGRPGLCKLISDSRHQRASRGSRKDVLIDALWFPQNSGPTQRLKNFRNWNKHHDVHFNVFAVRIERLSVKITAQALAQVT
jgi:hypothetical protein